MARHRLIFAAVAAVTVLAFAPTSGAAPTTPAQDGSGRPVLHAISPTAVPAAGAMIAVGGSRLKQVHSVSFGNTVVHHVHNVSSTRLTVRAPKHALGQVAVTLHSGNGSSQAAQLNYVRPPARLQWHADNGIDPHRGELTDVSCVTANFCVAVEHDRNTATRLLRFGTSTEPKITSVPSAAGVYHVGCGSKQFCVAGPATGAYIWNGSHWTGPKHLGSRHLAFGPVCARGTTTCLYYSNTKTLIHTGSTWTSVRLPASLAAIDISCATATFCEALESGTDPSRQFAHYDGSSWQLDSAAADDGFDKIACAAPDYCVATGAGAGSDELIGSDWTPLAGNPKFSAVSLDCGAPGHCVAVRDGLGAAAILGGGHWVQSGIPDEFANTTAVSCPTATLCRAADRQGRTFDLVNDTWSAGRQLVAATGHLLDVSCASRHWCMAIDGSGNALRWQDGQWSKPQQIDKNHGLGAISCAPDRSCSAVTTVLGPYPDFHELGEAIRHVHGHWQHPEQIDPTQSPLDVSCPSSSYCAVNDHNGRVIVFQHGTWSAPGQPVFRGDYRRTIDCVSSTHCVSVGKGGTLIFNGTTWHHVPQPGDDTYFRNIDCVDASFCVASAGELHAGVWSQLPLDDIDPAGPSCASRTLCVTGGPVKGEPVEAFNGAAVGPQRSDQVQAISCAPGPLCVALTDDSALVGTR